MPPDEPGRNRRDVDRLHARQLRGLLARLSRFYRPLAPPPPRLFAHWLWHVLWLQSTPQARDAALGALRRIPAVTPDAIARTAPARLEAALALAGPNPSERRRLVMAGVDMFRRARDLDVTIRGSYRSARRALQWFGRLHPELAQWTLLFAGGHPVLPLDARICRPAVRLGWGGIGGQPRRSWRAARRDLAAGAAGDLATIQQAAHLLAHHGSVSCTEAAPHCVVCPLAEGCPGRRDARDRTES